MTWLAKAGEGAAVLGVGRENPPSLRGGLVLVLLGLWLLGCPLLESVRLAVCFGIPSLADSSPLRAWCRRPPHP